MNLFTDEQHLAFLRGIGVAACLYILAKGVLWLTAPFLNLHGF
jgi:hypothetical protein